MADVLTPLKRYDVGPVKAHVQTIANFIGNKFGLKTIYGWRASDPFPDHPSGHALDFMISSKEQGDQIAQELIGQANTMGLKYLIWNRQTWNPQRGTWERYTSTGNPHTDHVHATFTDSPASDLGSKLAAYAGGGATPQGLNSDQDFKDSECAMPLKLPKYTGIGPDFGGGKICLLSKVQARVPAATFFFISATVVGLVGVTLLVVYGLKSTSAGNALTSAVSALPAGKLLSKGAKKAGNG